MMWIRRYGLGLLALLFSHITVRFVSMSQDLMLPSTEQGLLIYNF